MSAEIKQPHVISEFQHRLPHFTILFEAVPPLASIAPDKLETKLRGLENLLKPLKDANHLDAVLIPDLAEDELNVKKFDSLAYSLMLRERLGVDAVPSKVVANMSIDTLGQWLGQAQMSRLSSFVFVGGSSSINSYNLLVTAANSRTVSAFPEVMVGNICIPTRRTGITDALLPTSHTQLDEPTRIFEKTKAGCTFFPTQVVWSVQPVLNCLEQYDQLCQREGIQPGAILLALTPVDSKKDIDFLKRLRVEFDPALEERLCNSENMLRASMDLIKEMFSAIHGFVKEKGIQVPLGVLLSPIWLRNEKHMPELAAFFSQFHEGPNRAAPIGNVVDGPALARAILGECTHIAQAFPRRVGLALVRVGKDPASRIYHRTIKSMCGRAGVAVTSLSLDSASSTTNLIISEIKRLNERGDVDGVLVHQPLPDHLDANAIFEAIDPNKDVDGVHPITVGRLLQRKPVMHPCAPKAIVKIIQSTGVNLAGKNVLVVGAQNLVGRPLGLELLLEGCTVSTTNRFTDPRALQSLCSAADVVITGVGRSGVLDESWLPQHCVVVDAGVSVDKVEEDKEKPVGEGKKKAKARFGDIDKEKVRQKVRWVCPMKGGTGPVIAATLIENTIGAAQRRIGKA